MGRSVRLFSLFIRWCSPLCGLMAIAGGVAQAQFPHAEDDMSTTYSHSAVAVDVLSNDSPGSSGAPLDPGSVEIVTAPGVGSASVNSSTGLITYTPVAGFSGVASFEYGVRDLDSVPSNVATVDVWVFHYPPEAEDDSAIVSYLEPGTFEILDNDVSGTAAIDPDSVTITDAPDWGSVSVDADGLVTYTPGGLNSVSDSFEYTVADTDGIESEPAQVTVDVVNYAPEITYFDGEEMSGGEWYFEGYVLDEEPSECTVELGGILGGSVSPGLDGIFSFTVNLGEVSTDIATAQAEDVAGQESPVVETIIFSYSY